MKLSFLALATLGALVVPAIAQEAPSTPTPASQFDWKLRLAKGQKWTQTLITKANSNQEITPPTGGKKSKLDLEITQTLALKNEVLDVTPTYYLIRSTYSRYATNSTVKVDGKLQKTPSSPALTPDFIGATFTIKQAPDGRILDITGLEDLVARQKKMMASLSKDPALRELVRNMTPSTATFKQAISRTAALSLARKPLAVGESYSYGISVPVLGSLNFSINGKRTLLSFDPQTAVFDEGGTFSVPPTQMLGPTGDKIALTDDAAKLYTVRQYKAKHNIGTTYLSRNGRIYYRDAKNPRNVIWLDPPAAGIQLSKNEAESYKDIRGYNGQNTGKALDYFYGGPATTNSVPSGLKPSNPVPSVVLPKVFITMNGVMAGKSTVDATTGLTLQSAVTMTITGHTTAVGPDGHKQIIPMLVHSQSTVSTQKG